MPRRQGTHDPRQRGAVNARGERFAMDFDVA
jgi:hypothetical protein